MKKGTKQITLTGFIFILALAFLPAQLCAQKVGTTSFQFLKVAPDARGSAMGGAYVAVVNTADAAFWNPAALNMVERAGVSLSYVDWFFDTSISAVSATYKLGRYGTIGFHGIYNDYGKIHVTMVSHLEWADETTYNPGLTGEVIQPNSRVAGFSYARRLTNKFTFGLTAKYATEDLVSHKHSTLMFDGGIVFETGYRSLVIGTSLQNFGPEVKYINESFPLPQTFRVGISAKLLGPDASLLFHTGNQELLLAYDLVHPRDYGQQHQVGLEYTIAKAIMLRSGYKMNYDEQSLTYGLGVALSVVRVDYAYDPFGEYLDAVHRVTAGFQF